MNTHAVKLVRGWPIVGLSTVVIGVSIAAIALTNPDQIEALHSSVRTTARFSVALFLLAFTAGAMFRFWPSAATRWLRQNRRYIGVSFAVSHFIHLGAIFSLRELAPAELAHLPQTTWIFGGLAYAFIAAMTLTSFDRTAQLIGPRAWRLLHTIGSYYIWIVFANSYISRALAMPEYVPIALLVIAALGLRIAARVVHARAAQTAPAN